MGWEGVIDRVMFYGILGILLYGILFYGILIGVSSATPFLRLSLLLLLIALPPWGFLKYLIRNF